MRNGGTGIGKIKRLEPKTKFEVVADFFRVTLLRKNIEHSNEIVVRKLKISKNELKNKRIPKEVLIKWLGKGWEKVGKRLGINQLKIIIVISENNLITIGKLAFKLDISTTAIEKNIKKLRDENLLIRVGGRKEGNWEIKLP